MSTVVVRIDEAVLADVKAVAAMRGVTPGDALAGAWREFVEHHREAISADFDHVAEMFRANDREGLLGSHDRHGRGGPRQQQLARMRLSRA